jgi:AhpD family alkylhydroperoxidase
MPLLNPLADHEMSPEARAVLDDIRATRGTDYVNDIWRVLAHDPRQLRLTWESAKQVMGPGALDPLVKELVYIAVSALNNCEYCLHTHAASARAKGMTDAMLHELMQVVTLASQTNRLAIGYQVELDARYRPDAGRKGET